MSVGKYRKNPRKNWPTLNGCNSKNSKRMTTPLSKMATFPLIPSPLTPKRGLGSVGSLSEAKKGVAKVCGDRLSSVGDYSWQRTPTCVFRGRLESPKDLQGLIQVLLVTSQLLSKGHKMLNFLFLHFYWRFPRLWKLISLEQKQISVKSKTSSSQFLINGPSY